MVRISLDDSFDLLGVNELSSEMEVKAAYKRLALQTHPDKNPNNPAATEQFRRISEAYQRISRYMDDETDDDDEYDDEDDYDDEDYDDDYDAAMMFIFEKMFREFNGEPGPPGIRMRFDDYNQYGPNSSSSSRSSNGPSNDEVPSSSSRNRMHHCDCPNCSGGFPRPGNGTAWREPEKKIYIPKSQRPKDPTKQQPSDANAKMDPHANWLSEDEHDAEATRKIRSNNSKPSSKKKKASKKKKKPNGGPKDGEKQHSAAHQTTAPSEEDDSEDEEPEEEEEEEEDTAIYCMESAPVPPPVKKTQTQHRDHQPQVKVNNVFKSPSSDVPGPRTREGSSSHRTRDSSEAAAVESKEKGDDVGSNRNHKTAVSSASYKGGKTKSNQATDIYVSEGAANDKQVGSSDYRKPVYNNKNEKAAVYNNNNNNSNNKNENISKSIYNVRTDKGVVDAKINKATGSNAKAVNNGHEKVVGGTKMNNNTLSSTSSIASITTTTTTTEKKPVEESKGGYKVSSMTRSAASHTASAKTINNNLSYAKDLSVLTEMGFDVRPALEALQRAMGNLDTALNILIAAAEAAEEAAKVASNNAYIHMPSEKASDGAGQFNASSSPSITHPRSRNQEQSEQFEIDNNNKNNISSKRPHVKPSMASMKAGPHATEGPKKVNKKCNFFLSAVGCRNGSSCKFIHETNSTS